MEGLILPLGIFAVVCLLAAIKLGAISAMQSWRICRRIRKLLQLELPPSHYTLLQDVKLASHKEPVLIDHVLVSAYGIFVIKHVLGGGQITGKPGDARWSRSSRRGSRQFDNPLFSCVAGVNALRKLLDLDPSRFHFVLVFSGNVKFINPMPVNVTQLDGLPLFIQGKDKLLIDFDAMPGLVERIQAARPKTRVLRSDYRRAIAPHY